MRPRADAIAVILMLGSTPHDIEIDEAFKEAGIDRNAKQYLLMMGYIRDAGAGPYVHLKRGSLTNVTHSTRLYTATPKGLGLLK